MSYGLVYEYDPVTGNYDAPRRCEVDDSHHSRAIPKPEPRARVKARRRRQEATIVRTVRAQVAQRDGFCRLRGTPLDGCAGRSEWAHFGQDRRARTRGRAPEARHRTDGTLMLCTIHHRAYDVSRQLSIFAVMEPPRMEYRGADGPLEFRYKGVVYREESP